MKKTLKVIATIAIVFFGLLWISSKFNFLNDYNSLDIRNLFVFIYLFTSLKYYQMEIKDKNSEIMDLKLKLKKQE